MAQDYEDIAPALKEFKIENDGIWISWSDLWRIDAVACRNALRALSEAESGDECSTYLFQNFIGQRMLIEELSQLFNKNTQDEN
jgi:hypothetical protein